MSSEPSRAEPTGAATSPLFFSPPSRVVLKWMWNISRRVTDHESVQSKVCRFHLFCGLHMNSCCRSFLFAVSVCDFACPWFKSRFPTCSIREASRCRQQLSTRSWGAPTLTSHRGSRSRARARASRDACTGSASPPSTRCDQRFARRHGWRSRCGSAAGRCGRSRALHERFDSAAER